MTFRFRRWLVPAGVATVLFAGAAQASAGVVDPIPIRPNQHFTPLVNGQSGGAQIAVTCNGPDSGTTPTGHPVAGQTIEVRLALEVQHPGDGFTGSAANAISVGLNASSSANLPIVLRSYGVAVPIPTDILVPCDGGAIIPFTPNPVSRTAQRGAVKVTFLSQR